MLFLFDSMESLCLNARSVPKWVCPALPPGRRPSVDQMELRLAAVEEMTPRAVKATACSMGRRNSLPSPHSGMGAVTLISAVKQLFGTSFTSPRPGY